jgi:hypothetical protein
MYVKLNVSGIYLVEFVTDKGIMVKFPAGGRHFYLLLKSLDWLWV